MEKYREFVSNLAKQKIDNTFINSDEEHALEVFVNLFQIANSNVRIFAKNLCSDVSNKPEYVEKLSDFIEKGGNVDILVNGYNKDESINSNLFKRLAYYKSIGKSIVIKSTNVKPHYKADPDKKEIHFTVIDNCAYRIETDIEKRTANCNFNNEGVAKGLVHFFESTFNESVEIDIVELFNLGSHGDK